MFTEGDIVSVDFKGKIVRIRTSAKGDEMVTVKDFTSNGTVMMSRVPMSMICELPMPSSFGGDTGVDADYTKERGCDGCPHNGERNNDG